MKQSIAGFIWELSPGFKAVISGSAWDGIYWGQMPCVRGPSSDSTWLVSFNPNKAPEGYTRRLLPTASAFFLLSQLCFYEMCALQMGCQLQHWPYPWKECPERTQGHAGIVALASTLSSCQDALHPCLDDAGEWGRACLSTFLPCCKNKKFMSMLDWKEGLGNHYWKHKRLISPIKWQQ